MTCSDFGRSALGICAIAAMLSGCGASESPIAAPESDAAVRTISHRIEPASSSYQLLYSFGGGSDGAAPYAGLINVNGMLYGTTLKGVPTAPERSLALRRPAMRRCCIISVAAQPTVRTRTRA